MSASQPFPLITVTPQGLYCAPGGFHIAPWRPVERAPITHARSGSRRYLGAWAGKGLLHQRLGADSVIDTLEYGERLTLNGVTVSLHPAGHVLGRAQRSLAELARLTDRPAFAHGALNSRIEAGVHMLPTQRVSEVEKGTSSRLQRLHRRAQRLPPPRRARLRHRRTRRGRGVG